MKTLKELVFRPKNRGLIVVRKTSMQAQRQGLHAETGLQILQNLIQALHLLGVITAQKKSVTLFGQFPTRRNQAVKLLAHHGLFRGTKGPFVGRARPIGRFGSGVLSAVRFQKNSFETHQQIKPLVRAGQPSLQIIGHPVPALFGRGHEHGPIAVP